MLHANGTKLFDESVEIKLIGVNDTTGHGTQMAMIIGALPEGYRYGNHNLPQYPFPGSTNSDADCKLPSSSYKEFWWKYCWLLKNAFGGPVASQDPNNHYPLTGTTYMNHLRVGWPDQYFRDRAYQTYKTNRAEFEQAMRDMLDVAAAAGVYLNITLMGGGSELNGAFGAGYVFIPGSEAFNNAVQFQTDVINMCGNHKAIAMFCLNNEPVNYNGDGHDIVGRSPWWDYYYGRVVRTIGPFAGYEEWEARYLEWKNAFVLAIRAKIVANPQPLLEIGGGNFTIFWATWDGHTQANIDWEKKRTLDYAANVDMTVGHGYSQAEYNDAMDWARQTMNFINKPSYAEEYGFAETAEPWRYCYWPWYDLKCQQVGFSQCVMVMSGIADPQPPGGAAIYPQPPYPGYPLTKVDDWTYKNAQGAVFVIPPVPDIIPEPPPEPPSVPVVIGSLPAFDVVIPAEQIAQGKVVVKIPDVTGTVPNGATVPTLAYGSFTFLGKKYTVPVSIPALKVITPAFKIIMPTITFDLPPVNIPMDTIHIGTMVVMSE